MTEGRFVAYYRVSTARQGKSGLGLEAQRQAVLEYLNGGNWELADEYVEVESGKRPDRPQLQEALRACRRAKATLVIAKLDRLARNVAFISSLMEAGVDFVAADLPQANKLTLHVMAAMAEYERDQISARTKAALQAAKARGVKLGGPRVSEIGGAGRQKQAERAVTQAGNVLPIIQEIRAAGVASLQGIADALNARGIVTPRKGQWHANSVRRVLLRGEAT